MAALAGPLSKSGGGAYRALGNEDGSITLPGTRRVVGAWPNFSTGGGAGCRGATTAGNALPAASSGNGKTGGGSSFSAGGGSGGSFSSGAGGLASGSVGVGFAAATRTSGGAGGDGWLHDANTNKGIHANRTIGTILFAVAHPQAS